MEDQQLFDTEKFMKQYSRLSQNKLETDVAKSFAADVKKHVQDAQDRADQIVNALTSRSKPPDFNVARSALSLLARAPSVLVAHWQPFIAAVAEVMPPRVEGELEDVKAVDTAAESGGVKDLRAALGSIGAVLPLASARELRELREGFAMLGDAIGVEFGKRGMEFSRDGSSAVLDRLNDELTIAAKPEPLPKNFAFSDPRVMEMRAHLDAQREQLIAADAQMAEMRENAAASSSDDDAKLKRIGELEKEVETTHATRDEMAKAADAAVARADTAEQALLAEKKANADGAFAFEEFKKLHKKPKCG